MSAGECLADGGGKAKLADFGLVRRLGDRESGGGGSAGGTPTFMARNSSSASAVTSTSHGVGVMYFYLLSARLPYFSDNLARLIKLHVRRRSRCPPVPPDVAPGMAAILAPLGQGSRDRPASAEELAAVQRTFGALADTEQLVLERFEGLGDSGSREARRQFRSSSRSGQPAPGGLHRVIENRKKDTPVSVFVRLPRPADSKTYEFALS